MVSIIQYNNVICFQINRTNVLKKTHNKNFLPKQKQKKNEFLVENTKRQIIIFFKINSDEIHKIT